NGPGKPGRKPPQAVADGSFAAWLRNQAEAFPAGDTDGKPHPGGPEAIAQQMARAPGAVARARGLVTGDALGAIDEVPSLRHQVERHEVLLGPEEEARLVASDATKGCSTHHHRARHESGEAAARQSVARQRAARHVLAG